ncbi:MAG: molybdopterin converting factor, subunit 2 [Capsulimonas sp.]|jgi:molybdopterin converting factor subunit 1|nr:molybdopterin converting factor, subunit 2 [Capsulimonas sp.]
MQVNILLFASYQDAAGTDKLTLDLPESASVADCTKALAGRFPALAPRLPAGRVAVNADFAKDATVLRDGDEVAFLPPMSGG